MNMFFEKILNMCRTELVSFLFSFSTVGFTITYKTNINLTFLKKYTMFY